jgi:hypothetical protein
MGYHMESLQMEFRILHVLHDSLQMLCVLWKNITRFSLTSSTNWTGSIASDIN